MKDEQQKSEVSLYGSGKVDATCFALNVVKLKQAFPDLPNGFYDLLETMLDEEGFTNQRLDHAVKNLVKTCVYPKPTIANILGYDKTAKIKSHEDMLVHTKDFSPKSRGEYYALHVWNYRLDGYIEKKYQNLFPKTDFAKQDFERDLTNG